MQVEHDGPASNLVIPCVTFLTPYNMPEQIANRTEHRFSIIALRRQGGEALRELLSEENKLVVIDPMFHMAFGVLPNLVQWCRPMQPGRFGLPRRCLPRRGQAANGNDVLRQSFPDIDTDPLIR